MGQAHKERKVRCNAADGQRCTAAGDGKLALVQRMNERNRVCAGLPISSTASRSCQGGPCRALSKLSTMDSPAPGPEHSLSRGRGLYRSATCSCRCSSLLSGAAGLVSCAQHHRADLAAQSAAQLQDARGHCSKERLAAPHEPLGEQRARRSAAGCRKVSLRSASPTDSRCSRGVPGACPAVSDIAIPRSCSSKSRVCGNLFMASSWSESDW